MSASEKRRKGFKSERYLIKHQANRNLTVSSSAEYECSTRSGLVVQLAIDYGIKFLETSAKSSINVEEVSPDPAVCLIIKP